MPIVPIARVRVGFFMACFIWVRDVTAKAAPAAYFIDADQAIFGGDETRLIAHSFPDVRLG